MEARVLRRVRIVDHLSHYRFCILDVIPQLYNNSNEHIIGPFPTDALLSSHLPISLVPINGNLHIPMKLKRRKVKSY